MPAPRNNKNATKPEGEVASAFLHIRCKESDKDAWKAIAKQEGTTLAKVVVDLLNRWSGRL